MLCSERFRADVETKRCARGLTCFDRAESSLPHLNKGPVCWRGSDSLRWKLDRSPPLPVALCDGLGSGNGIEPAQQTWRVFLIPFAGILGAAASHERSSNPAIWSPSGEYSKAQQAMYGNLATQAISAHAWHPSTSRKDGKMVYCAQCSAMLFRKVQEKFKDSTQHDDC